MLNDSEVIKVGVEAALSPFVHLIQQLAGPAAEEIGLAFHDSIKAWRFKRQLRLLQKLKEYLDVAGITPKQIPIKLLVPALNYATLEEDNTLQDRWAMLLANAADPKSEIENLPSFAEILKQLSFSDARFLEVLFACECESFRPGHLGPGLRDKNHLLTLYIKTFAAQLCEMTRSDIKTPENIKLLADRTLSFEVTLTNLLRLGIVTETLSLSGPARLNKDVPEIQGKYGLTHLGVEFCKACCQPPKK
jgi:hypothetical protein